MDEEIVFSDNTGLTLSGDVAVTVRIQPGKAPALYEKYRMSTDELIHGIIRNAIRSSINDAGEKMSSEEIYTGGKSRLIQTALVEVQKEFAGSGIDVLNLEWLGGIRYPQPVINAITLKTTKLQEAEAAKADEARAIAQGNANVAAAKAAAEANRLVGESLRANPQIIQQQWIMKWNGELPSTMTGQSSVLMVQPK